MWISLSYGKLAFYVSTNPRLLKFVDASAYIIKTSSNKFPDTMGSM